MYVWHICCSEKRNILQSLIFLQNANEKFFRTYYSGKSETESFIRNNVLSQNGEYDYSGYTDNQQINIRSIHIKKYALKLTKNHKKETPKTNRENYNKLNNYARYHSG